MLDFKLATLTQLYKDKKIDGSKYVEKLSKNFSHVNYVIEVILKDENTITLVCKQDYKKDLPINELLKPKHIVQVLLDIEYDLVTEQAKKLNNNVSKAVSSVMDKTTILIEDDELREKFYTKIGVLQSKLGDITIPYTIFLVFMNLKKGRTNLDVIKYFTNDISISEMIHNIKQMPITILMMESISKSKDLPSEHILSKYRFRLYYYSVKEFIYRIELVPIKDEAHLPILDYTIDVFNQDTDIKVELDESNVTVIYPYYDITLDDTIDKETYFNQFKNFINAETLIDVDKELNLDIISTDFVKEYPYVEEILKFTGIKGIYSGLVISKDSVKITLNTTQREEIFIQEETSEQGETLHVIDFIINKMNLKYTYKFSEKQDMVDFLEILMFMFIQRINLVTFANVLSSLNDNFKDYMVRDNVYINLPINNGNVQLSENVKVSKGEHISELLKLDIDFGEGNLQVVRSLPISDCLNNLKIVNQLTGVVVI